MQNIELFVWGMRGTDGSSTLFSSPTLDLTDPENIQATKEVRFIGLDSGIEFYSLEVTSRHKVFAKYRVLEGRESFVSFVLFVPKGLRVEGGEKKVLDDLVEKFVEKHIGKTHKISQVELDSKFFLNLVRETITEKINVENNLNNWKSQINGNYRGIYIYQINSEIEAIFSYPFYPAFKPYERVILLRKHIYDLSSDSFSSLTKIETLNFKQKHYNLNVDVKSSKENVTAKNPNIEINDIARRSLMVSENDIITIKVSHEGFKTSILSDKVLKLIENANNYPLYSIQSNGETINVIATVEPEEYLVRIIVKAMDTGELISHANVTPTPIKGYLRIESGDKVDLTVRANGFYTYSNERITDSDIKDKEVCIYLKRDVNNHYYQNGVSVTIDEVKKVNCTLVILKNGNKTFGDYQILNKGEVLITSRFSIVINLNIIKGEEYQCRFEDELKSFKANLDNEVINLEFGKKSKKFSILQFYVKNKPTVIAMGLVILLATIMKEPVVEYWKKNRAIDGNSLQSDSITITQGDTISIDSSAKNKDTLSQVSIIAKVQIPQNDTNGNDISINVEKFIKMIQSINTENDATLFDYFDKHPNQINLAKKIQGEIENRTINKNDIEKINSAVNKKFGNSADNEFDITKKNDPFYPSN